MKKMLWTLAFALAAAALIGTPATVSADETAAPAAIAAPAQAPAAAAEPFSLAAALAEPLVTPVEVGPESLPVQPSLMACFPSECPCPAGFRCVAKCCV